MEIKNVDGEYFLTKSNSTSGRFAIKIIQESDCSKDDGYSFETITNVWHLDKQEAQELIKELQQFVNAA